MTLFLNEIALRFGNTVVCEYVCLLHCDASVCEQYLLEWIPDLVLSYRAHLIAMTIQVNEERGMTDEQCAVANSNFQFVFESFVSRVIVQLRH